MKPILLALIATCLTATGALALVIELGALFGAGHSQPTRMAAMAQGRPQVGYSTNSHMRVLEHCSEVLTDPRIFDDGPAVRETILSHCESQVTQVLVYAPTDGFAWWIRATLAAERNDIPGSFAALERSRQNAPHELWIALRRAQMDAFLEPVQTPHQREGQDSDLLVLARSYRGVRYLAQRYLEDTTFRERVVTLVETLPVDDQRRFLGHVRQASRGLIP